MRRRGWCDPVAGLVAHRPRPGGDPADGDGRPRRRPRVEHRRPDAAVPRRGRRGWPSTCSPQVAVDRHGQAAVVRALSRPQRARAPSPPSEPMSRRTSARRTTRCRTARPRSASGRGWVTGPTASSTTRSCCATATGATSSTATATGPWRRSAPTSTPGGTASTSRSRTGSTTSTSAPIVRTANAFLAAEVHIVGNRRWNRRGAMVTDRYQHLRHHASPADLAAHLPTSRA